MGFKEWLKDLGSLASKVRSAYENWCSSAVERVKEEQEKTNSKSILESTKEIYDTNRERLQKRLKSLHHKVVSGTENIVKLFQGNNIRNKYTDITVSHEISVSDRTNTPSPDTSIMISLEKGDESLVNNRDLEDGNLQQPQNNTSNNPKHHTYNPVIWFALFFCILILLLIYLLVNND